MNLHSNRIIDPVVWIIAQATFLGRWILRFAVIGGKKNLGDTKHRPMYVALGWLNPGEWVTGFEVVHRLVSDVASPRLVGQTFERAGMKVRQNQLLLLRRIPRFLVPASLRYRVAGKKQPFWWCVEVYDFYAINTNGELGRYGRFVEIAPAERKFDPRWMLGWPTSWLRAGKSDRFEEYLRSDVLPVYPQPQDNDVMGQARRAGALFALSAACLLPVMVRWMLGYPQHLKRGIWRPAYAA